MAKRNISAYGIYSDHAAVTEAIRQLKEAGFRPTDISVLHGEGAGVRDFAHERHSKAPEGAVAGGGAGAAAGSALGWLVGAGALMVPGLEPFAAAGPVVGMLGGMGVGVTVGGLMGALAGSGVPEYEAKLYAGRLKKGGILVSVHCDDSRWAKTARTMLKKTGARDVSVTGEARGDFAHSDKPTPRPGVHVDSHH